MKFEEVSLILWFLTNDLLALTEIMELQQVRDMALYKSAAIHLIAVFIRHLSNKN